MNKKESVVSLRNYVTSNPSASLGDALADSSASTAGLLAAIVYALGFGHVQVNKVGPDLKVYSGYDSAGLSEVLAFSPQTQELHGRFADMAPKIYAVIRAIENELTDAIYLPPEMRKLRVLAVCDAIGIGEEQYRSVLANWLLR